MIEQKDYITKAEAEGITSTPEFQVLSTWARELGRIGMMGDEEELSEEEKNLGPEAYFLSQTLGTITLLARQEELFTSKISLAECCVIGSNEYRTLVPYSFEDIPIPSKEVIEDSRWNRPKSDTPEQDAVDDTILLARNDREYTRQVNIGRVIDLKKENLADKLKRFTNKWFPDDKFKESLEDTIRSNPELEVSAEQVMKMVDHIIRHDELPTPIITSPTTDGKLPAPELQVE